MNKFNCLHIFIRGNYVMDTFDLVHPEELPSQDPCQVDQVHHGFTVIC